eukprot:2238792-Pyramimonas_sp.AAC.2
MKYPLAYEVPSSLWPSGCRHARTQTHAPFVTKWPPQHESPPGPVTCWGVNDRKNHKSDVGNLVTKPTS